MLRLVMPQWLTVLVDIVAWGLFHAATGYAAHRLGDNRLARDGWLLRPRQFEAGGRFYRRLRIHRWKDRLPEAGALFEGGVSKRELPATDREGLTVFVRETRRGECAVRDDDEPACLHRPARSRSRCAACFARTCSARERVKT